LTRSTPRRSSSKTAELCAAHAHVTEVQPGSFAFMDADYLAVGGVP
jgi:hypothetical protein